MFDDPTKTSDPFVEAELALLGAMLYEPDLASLTTDVVRADHFWIPLHRQVWAASLELLSEGGRPDHITVGHRLDGIREFAEAGGVHWLARLVADAPPGANARDYAEIVRDGWKRRELAEIASLATNALTTRGDVSFDEIAERLEARLLEIQEHARGVRLVDANEAVDAVFSEMEDGDKGFALDVGIESLDAALGGLGPGEMWLLAGRPSMGKSAVASSIALNVARHGRRPDGRPLGVIEISAEMTVPALMRRHITDWAYELAPRDAPSYAAIRRHRKKPLPPEQLALVAHVGNDLRQLRTLKLVKKTGITLNALRSLIRRQVAQWKREGIELGAVVIDHGGLVRPDNGGRSRYEDQTAVAIGLKELAGDFGVPFLVLVQLSRDIEKRDDKRPMLSDLRDSGGWEENADGVIGIFRDAYYAQREPKPARSQDVQGWEDRKSSRTIEALLLKVREGAAGTVELFGDMPRNAIRSSRPDNAYGLGAEFVPPGGLPFARSDAPAPAPPPEPADLEPAEVDNDSHVGFDPETFL